ncbi:MAG: hypothetical protein KDB53_05875, partial [Planctomycetes bacterium]|nr:hypothetical protein [Planctomycetota bacterium]
MSDEILDERQRLIQAGLDGELNAKDIALRAKLLAGDADARDEATSLAALRELIAEDRASIRAPIGLAGRMNEELARRMAPAPVTRARWSPLRSLAAAASILVLVGASFVLGRQTTSAAVDTVL